MAITSNETLHQSYESRHKVFNPLKIFKSVAKIRNTSTETKYAHCSHYEFFLQQRSYGYLVTLTNKLQDFVNRWV